ncbi:hypothetical protein PASE110613_00815 [Paenibacillus sediminis]|uniref:Phage phiEco32-like COOH.NH2 ligase-type 2 n=1 Tax=Paenibacillus sediminis TaxID=664909 RepID=A0ABS4H0I6_9BACL|nr:hypothetical protein [Paenibacillus sediminis]MBP1935877.1 hypothetical protein [Paenibacillus sediminis]
MIWNGPYDLRLELGNDVSSAQLLHYLVRFAASEDEQSHLGLPLQEIAHKPSPRLVHVIWKQEKINRAERNRSAALILNRGDSRYHRWNHSVCDELLRLSGISSNLQPTSLGKPKNYAQSYIVHVFNLEAIGIQAIRSSHATQKMSEFLEIDRSKSYIQSIERTAVRAIYTLGLDFGEVVLTADEGRHFIVESVKSTPELHLATARLYAQAILKFGKLYSSESPRDSSIMLGMDPEFLLVNPFTGKIASASRYLEAHGEAGYDAITRNGKRIFPIAELRPDPSAEPRQLMTHLLHALHRASDLIPDSSLIWQAGGMPKIGFPLGGHIHFSGMANTSELLRVLDNYLTLPVAVLEGRESGLRRPQYGFLGDFRTQPYGGFEYRTLPSFLVSPVVAKGVVSAAKLIAVNYERLTLRPLDDLKILRAFYNGERETLRYAALKVIDDLTSLDDYYKYEEYLLPFLKAVQAGKQWDEKRDIRPLWKIYSSKC